jgi:SAM-dependent methyltransferase
MRIENCRICNAKDLKIVLDYGEVALADNFLNKSEVPFEKKYPLRLCICLQCKHVQIDDIIDPSILFEHYVWNTGVSKSVLQFADELYDKISSKFGYSKPDVLEIACNDGSILSVFKNNGCDVLGVDPAKNIVEIALSRGIRAIPKFFNLETANFVNDKFGKKDVIIARNVLAHVFDLHGLVKGIKLLLSSHGFASIEFPQLKTTFNELQYDQVFHEHIGFHSLDSVVTLFKMYDMEVFDAEELWIHGGSLRVFIQHNQGPRKIEESVERLLQEEINIGLLEVSSWIDFSSKAIAHRVSLKKEIERLKNQGKKVIIYGASGKGQSLLQFCGIDNSLIDCVIDKSEMKQGKLTPGTHIPIYSPSFIGESKAEIILLCAWNFAKEIMEQEHEFITRGGRFLHPVPDPHFLN